MKSVIVILSVLMMLTGMGCAALSDYVTPAVVDSSAVKYAREAGVAEPTEYDGYANLDKAKRLQADVDSAHSTVQLTLQQCAEKDNLTYSTLKKTVASNLAVAAHREEMLFGSQGLLSMGLGMLGMGTLTGFLGLMRKRPGDVTSAELERAVADANGQATTELSAKQRQFAQLVQGVAGLLQSMNESPLILASAKSMLNQTQDTETQIAVAAVRKELNL